MLYKNGIIIQSLINEGLYNGIEGNNWDFTDLPNRKYEEYFDNNIQKAWSNTEYVDCCTDMAFIKEYVSVLRSKGIRFRILFCETEKKYPIMKSVQQMEYKFIGYDYAYSGGSYYSCINNDLISGRINQFVSYKLNEYGLLSSMEDIVRFVHQRNMLQKENSDIVFEKGDFVIYRISEVINI